MKDIELTQNFKVHELGEQERWVYDLETKEDHNFFANNILIHNSLILDIDYIMTTILGDDWVNLDEEEKINKTVELSKIIEKHVNHYSYYELQRRDYNCAVDSDTFNITFEQEIVCRSTHSIQKKKYGMHTVWKEGAFKDDISVTGLEIVRSETPTLFREGLEEALSCILRHESDEKLKEIVEKYKKKARESPPEDISSNTTVNNLQKYINEDNSAIKGAPFHLVGTANYRKLLKLLKLENKYPDIQEGQKAHVIYLKSNPYGVNVVSFDTWPQEFTDAGLIYDVDSMIEKFFLRKVKFLLTPIGKEYILEQNSNFGVFFN